MPIYNKILPTGTQGANLNLLINWMISCDSRLAVTSDNDPTNLTNMGRLVKVSLAGCLHNMSFYINSGSTSISCLTSINGTPWNQTGGGSLLTVNTNFTLLTGPNSFLLTSSLGGLFYFMRSSIDNTWFSSQLSGSYAQVTPPDGDSYITLQPLSMAVAADSSNRKMMSATCVYTGTVMRGFFPALYVGNAVEAVVTGFYTDGLTYYYRVAFYTINVMLGDD